MVHARTVCKRGDDFDACTRGYLRVSDCTLVDSFSSSVEFGHLEQKHFGFELMVFTCSYCLSKSLANHTISLL